jgi:arginyl-tRNA synthetase
MAKATISPNADLSALIADEEQELLRQLAKMPDMTRHAIDEIKPSLVANQLLEIARAFNSFYHACPILNAEEKTKQARLALIDATRQVLVDGLALLGITAPTEM